MTEYVALDEADFIEGKSIDFAEWRAVMNNPLAIAEGADGAPRISRTAIQPGGAEIEGAFADGTAAPSEAGFYEYTSIALTVAKTFPFISILRVAGNVTLSSTLSLDTVGSSEITKAEWFNAIIGADGTGVTGGSNSGGGGGCVGAGGAGGNASAVGGSGRSMSNLNRVWLNRIPILGGRGGSGGGGRADGGGCMILIVHGDLDMSGGGIISANGASGTNENGGGGAGGSVIVICTGSVLGGTFRANGGDGHNGSGLEGGGGGGGFVAVIGSDLATNPPTLQASGGTGPEDGNNGSAGVTVTETLTEAQINGLLLR